MTSAWGHGLATVASDGTVLDTWYPAPRLGGAPDAFPADLAAETGPDERRDVRIEPVTLSIDTDAAPASTADAYLRLHLLSHRLVAPNTINLDGFLGHLPIVVWTNAGPVLPATFTARRRALQRAGITAKGYDRIPFLAGPMTIRSGERQHAYVVFDMKASRESDLEDQLRDAEQIFIFLRNPQVSLTTTFVIVDK